MEWTQKIKFQILVCVSTPCFNIMALPKQYYVWKAKGSFIYAKYYSGPRIGWHFGHFCKRWKIGILWSRHTAYYTLEKNMEALLSWLEALVTGFAKSACLALVFWKNYITFAIVAHVPIVMMDAKRIFKYRGSGRYVLFHQNHLERISYVSFDLLANNGPNIRPALAWVQLGSKSTSTKHLCLRTAQPNQA